MGWSTVNSDNFDGRTNGTDINGATVQVGGGTWTATAAEFVTDNTNPRSGANDILYNTRDGTTHNCYVSNQDSTNGDSRVTVAIWHNTIGSTDNVGEVRVRWQSPTATGDSTGSGYVAEFEITGGGTGNLYLFKNVSGTQTQLGSTVVLASVTVEVWYTVQIAAVGTTITVQMQRDSDSFYLTSGGAWQSGQAYAFNVTDSSVTGVGVGAFSGFLTGGSASQIRFDDFLFEQFTSFSPGTFPHTTDWPPFTRKPHCVAY